ncbi:MAG: YtrH family sporulation protein [Bacillota bacterium]
MTFFNNMVYSFLVCFGVIVGASIFAGLAALINNHPPFKAMCDIADSLKIWAVAIAVGGTFSSFEIFEKGIMKGDIRSLTKQVIYIVIALIAANLGCELIKMLRRCGDLW